MMSFSKTPLLAATAASALCIGMSAPAWSFDEVDWSWDLNVKTTVTETIDANIDLDPTGKVVLEDMQVFIGDLNANSTINGVNNVQPTSNGGNGSVSFTVDFSDPYDDSTNPGPYSGTATLGGDLSGTGNISGTVDEGGDRVDGTATFTDIAVSFDPDDSFDAVEELPEVVSAATAVANNVSIESAVAVNVHEGQFVFDTAYNGAGTDGPGPYSIGGVVTALAALGLYNDDLNSTYVVGGTALIAAALGVIDPATINANSNVSNIINASVDSTATAVGNNKSISILPGGDDDIDPHNNDNNLLVGDVTQFAYANISATSNVSNVTLNHYTNLSPTSTGGLGRAIVNSAATAVGNNLSVKVGIGDLDD